MSENRIGITIDAKTTGNENMQQHIQALNQMNAGWGHFNDLRMEAGRQFPDDLKKQNQFIREQIGLLSRLETMGNQERMADLQYQRQRQTSKFGKARLDKDIYALRTEHIKDTTTSIQGEAYRKEWAQAQGIGAPGEADILTELTGMGIRGVGPTGIAQMGLGKFASKVTGKMAAMSTMGKLAVGTGAGLAGFVAYKAISGIIQGKDAYKQIAPDLMMIQAMTGRLGTDAAAFREEFEAVAMLTGTTLKEMSGLEQSYIRLTGQRLRGTMMDEVVNTTTAFGIEKPAGVEFAARMGMTAYRPDPLPLGRLQEAIMEGVRSGIGEGRLPEFLQGVMRLTESVMRTSVTADSGLMGRYAGRLGGLGTPFQGQRGMEQLTGFNQAITSGGMGFQAARRILDRTEGAGNYSIGQGLALQEQGLQDPRLLEEFFSMAEELGGKNPWNQAMLLNKWTDKAVKMKELYNPDKEINSWLEMKEKLGGKMQLGSMTNEEFEAATGGLDMSEKDRELMRELATTEGFDKRIRELRETTGFEVQMRAVATEIGKIETAALAFEKANELFLRGALAIAELGLGSEAAQTILDQYQLPPKPPADNATEQRLVGMGNDPFSGMSKKSMSRHY